jgi:hypothetical protein
MHCAIPRGCSSDINAGHLAVLDQPLLISLIRQKLLD